MEERKQGIVIKGVGGNYDVACEGSVLRCRASAKLKHKSNILAAGEYVELRLTDTGGYITERLPRRNGLIRPAIANIDQLVILCSQAPPVTDPYLIDKVTVVALYQGITPIILLNKSDLDRSDELYEAYTKAGFTVLRTSAVTGEGVEEVKAHLAGKISAFTGNSAIGKSSILNRIDDRFGLQVGDEILEVDGEKLGVYRNSADEVYAVSVKCPHLGCQLEWKPAEKSWDCPCHGSRFDIHGQLLNTPATSNL